MSGNTCGSGRIGSDLACHSLYVTVDGLTINPRAIPPTYQTRAYVGHSRRSHVSSGMLCEQIPPRRCVHFLKKHTRTPCERIV